MILSHTARTLIKLSFIIVPALVGTLTLAASSHAAETVTKNAIGETVCPAGYAVAKRAVINPETGAIRVFTVCVK